MTVIAFPKKSLRPSLSTATLRALLEDTKDLLKVLRYEDEVHAQAATAQIEAIDDILTA